MYPTLSSLHLTAGISLKFIFCCFRCECHVSCKELRQNIPSFSLKTSHHVPVSLLYASGLLSVECWNLGILSVDTQLDNWVLYHSGCLDADDHWEIICAK